MALVFDRPAPDAPGYLRRRMAAARFFDAIEGGLSQDNIEAVIQFLLENAVEPEDRDEALELILDLSEDEYSKALREILGGGEVDPEAEGDSDDG